MDGWSWVCALFFECDFFFWGLDGSDRQHHVLSVQLKEQVRITFSSIFSTAGANSGSGFPLKFPLSPTKRSSAKTRFFSRGCQGDSSLSWHRPSVSFCLMRYMHLVFHGVAIWWEELQDCEHPKCCYCRDNSGSISHSSIICFVP